MRRVIALIWVFSACLAATAVARAQNSAPLAASAEAKPAFRPSGPVTIVVPYSPGGGTDQVELLRKRGADLTRKNQRGETAAGIVATAWSQGLADFYTGIEEAVGVPLDLVRIQRERPKLAQRLRG